MDIGLSRNELTLALYASGLLAALGRFFLCLLILIDVGHALTLRTSGKRRFAVDDGPGSEPSPIRRRYLDVGSTVPAFV